MNKITLFCFPYAGGSAHVYNAFRKFLDPAIELHSVELAGRGTRISQPFYKTFDELVEDVFREISPKLRSGRYAFFGHSLGVSIAYQLIEMIKERGLSLPEHIFFSGRGAPHKPKEDKKKYHLMEAEEFKTEMLKLGGTPKEFFDFPELAEVLLPVLKNDFKMAYEFEHLEEVCRVDQDITVFLGKEDEATGEQNDAWKDYTSAICNMIYFPGGHFFIHNEMEKMSSYINLALKPSLQKRIHSI